MTAVLAMELLEQLRRLELLSAAQLAELNAHPADDPDAELVRRGWLTPFQLGRLQAGRGEKLVLGNYLLLELLGEGGMGEVYKARHRRMDRLVALKAIAQGQHDDLDALIRFQREIKAVGHLDHPNIVRALDADEANGIHFYVMEYVEGTDLGKLVQQQGPLSIELACHCIHQVALGLQHAHERGLVHRDIKPSNLLFIRGDQTVKLLDLGLARLDRLRETPDTSRTLTLAGVVIGTPDFIAPEQARDAHTADIRADLYSLGCTFYYLLTGVVPFPEGTLIEKLLKHQMEQPVPLAGVRPDAPPAVCEVVSRLMAKRPEDRYRTPAEVADALAPLAGPVAPRPSGQVPHIVVPSTSVAPLATPRVQAAHPTHIESPVRQEPARIEKTAEAKPRRRGKLPFLAKSVAIFAGALLIAWLLKSKLIHAPSGENSSDGVVAADTGNSVRPTQARPSESVERALTALKKLQVNVTSSANRAEGAVAADFTGLTIGDADLAHLEALPQLEKLYLFDTPVGDEDLAHLGNLANLRNLNLGDTPVSDSGLTPLHKLRKLQTLDLTATKVSEEGVRKLRAALPEVKVAR
jgi:serine/threonine protein kinase